MSVHRPAGIIALTIIFFISAGLLILLEIAIANILIPGQYQSIYTLISLDWYGVSTGYTSFPLSYQGFPPIMGTYLTNLDYLNLGLIIISIFPLLYIVSSIGLLLMRNWGRYMALILGTLSLLVGIFMVIPPFLSIPPFFLVGLLFLVLGLATVVYLAGGVKYEFQ